MKFEIVDQPAALGPKSRSSFWTAIIEQCLANPGKAVKLPRSEVPVNKAQQVSGYFGSACRCRLDSSLYQQHTRTTPDAFYFWIDAINNGAQA